MADNWNELRKPLTTWLLPRIESATAIEVGDLGTHGAGYSAETIVVPLRVTREGRTSDERVVLRKEVSEPAIYPQQAPGLDVEVEIQFRTMEALRRASDLPLAPLLGFEPDPAVLGTPFFVMGFVEGEVPVLDPAYTKEGFFFDAKDQERHRMLESGLSALADFHRIDWQQAGFDWLVPPGTTPGASAQTELWASFGERELRGRVHPIFEAGVAHLRANLPKNETLCVSWGDSRPGNIIWQDFRPAALTDFENIAIGTPELDLGWWLMFDRTCHEGVSAPRLPGEPTRDEQRDLYCRAAGRDVGDMHYWEVLAAMRYCAIVVRVMNRYEQRGLLPADHVVWRNNPPTTVLAGLLDLDPEAG
jgi:aminoglycoside phosphotransferase (APT) family kinase protein